MAINTTKTISKVTYDGTEIPLKEPSGTIDINDNGTYSIKSYASAVVNCPDGTQGLRSTSNGVVIPSNLNKEEIIIPEKYSTISYNHYNDSNPYVKKIRTLNKNGLQTKAYILPTNPNYGSLAGFTNLEELDDRLITGTIQYSFLKGCNTLESIVFKNDISFGSYGGVTRAPFNCSNLKKLDFYNISNHVIYNYTFANATKLETLILRNEDGVVSLDATGAIPNQSVIKIYVPSTLLNVYKQATNWSAFADRIFSIDEVLTTTNLSKVIDGTITTLTADDFGDATSIRAFAFQGMSNLVSVTISPIITRIEQGAFANCNRLTSVIIGKNVRYIGYSVFGSCNSLTEMTILATTPPELAGTSAISSATNIIYIPAGTIDAYRTAANWSDISNKFVELS